MKITLPIHYTQTFRTKKSKTFLVGLNWYRNAHYLVSNKVKHDYHDMVNQQVAGCTFKKIRLHYDVYAARKGTDGHNIRAVIEKFFMDGMVEGGHIVDDDISHLVGDSSDYYIDKDNPRIEITITEV